MTPAEIDELGELEERLAPHQTAIKRVDALRSLLRDSTPDNVDRVDGARFYAVLGPRGFVSVIANSRVVKAIGALSFRKIATVSLKALKTIVSDAQLASIVKQEQTGPRALKVIKKPTELPAVRAA